MRRWWTIWLGLIIVGVGLYMFDLGRARGTRPLTIPSGFPLPAAVVPADARAFPFKGKSSFAASYGVLAESTRICYNHDHSNSGQEYDLVFSSRSSKERLEEEINAALKPLGHLQMGSGWHRFASAYQIQMPANWFARLQLNLFMLMHNTETYQYRLSYVSPDYRRVVTLWQTDRRYILQVKDYQDPLDSTAQPFQHVQPIP